MSASAVRDGEHVCLQPGSAPGASACEKRLLVGRFAARRVGVSVRWLRQPLQALVGPVGGRQRAVEDWVRVPAGSLEDLRRRIEALDRRADWLGCEPIRLLDTGERDRTGNALVALQGQAPVLAGWRLAAIVEHRDCKVTVRAVGETGERLAREAFATPWCEHCRLRRQRNKTLSTVSRLGGGELVVNDPSKNRRMQRYVDVAAASEIVIALGRAPHELDGC